MPLRTHRTAALAKIETTYGTDSVPTAAADALMLQEVEIQQLDADPVERPRLMPHFAARRVSLVSRKLRMTAQVDLAGSGTAGTAPAFGPLLRGCAMAQTVTAATKVDYTPVSAGEESLSLYWFLDGQRQRGLGARGTWSVELAARAFPRLSFEFLALYTTPTEVALPATTLTAWREPQVAGFGTTPVLTLDGLAVAAESLRYRHGNALAFRDLIGAQYVTITGRQPAIEVQIEAPTLTAKNFWSIAEAGTIFPLVAQQGTAAGSIAELSAPRCQITRIQRRESDGQEMLDLSLVVLPDLGNDEVTLTIR
jgi:hypothetical protein